MTWLFRNEAARRCFLGVSGRYVSSSASAAYVTPTGINGFAKVNHYDLATELNVCRELNSSLAAHLKSLRFHPFQLIGQHHRVRRDNPTLFRKHFFTMLKGIDPLLTPELLQALRAMGHGNTIAIVDSNL